MQILKQLVAVQRGGGGEDIFPQLKTCLIFDHDVLRFNFYSQVAG